MSEGERRQGAVWSPRREGDPETRFFLGSEGKAGEWAQFRDQRAGDGFGPVSLDYFPLPVAGRYLVAAVFRKSAGTAVRELRPAALYERELAGDLAGQLQTTVDVTPIPTKNAAEERRAFRLAEIEDRDRILAGDATRLAEWYHRGWCHFYLGHDEEAIRDFSHYIDAGGETSEFNWRLNNCHHFRAVAAARLGRKELSEKFLEQAAAAVPDDEHTRRLWRALADA